MDSRIFVVYECKRFAKLNLCGIYECYFLRENKDKCRVKMKNYKFKVCVLRTNLMKCNKTRKSRVQI